MDPPPETTTLEEKAWELLKDRPFLFAAPTYPDSLQLHYGERVKFTLPEFGDREHGSIILDTKASEFDWIGRGVGTRVTGLTVLLDSECNGPEKCPGFVLKLSTDAGDMLTVYPTPDEATDVPDWVIYAPTGTLVAGPGYKWRWEPAAAKEVQ